VMNIVEGMMEMVFKRALGIVIALPIERMSYDAAMNVYGSDKPDLRFEMKLVDLIEVFKDTEFKVFRGLVESKGSIKGICVKGGAAFSRKDIDDLTKDVGQYGAEGLAWFKVNDEGKLESQIAKFFNETELGGVKERTGAEARDLILMVASDWRTSCDALGALRIHVAEKLNLIQMDQYRLCWVTDFPLFEWDEDEKRFQALHHPFTAPRTEDVGVLDEDPARVLARAYDLVLNGTEIGGGSIRIHEESLQKKIFGILGIGEEEAETKFGFLLNALKYGAPPHGGIALGLDRVCAMLLGLDSIRGVIAFPKTQKGVCPLTEAPSEVDEKQLAELSIRVRKAKK